MNDIIEGEFSVVEGKVVGPPEDTISIREVKTKEDFFSNRGLGEIGVELKEVEGQYFVPERDIKDPKYQDLSTKMDTLREEQLSRRMEVGQVLIDHHIAVNKGDDPSITQEQIQNHDDVHEKWFDTTSMDGATNFYAAADKYTDTISSTQPDESQRISRQIGEYLEAARDYTQEGLDNLLRYTDYTQEPDQGDLLYHNRRANKVYNPLFVMRNGR